MSDYTVDLLAKLVAIPSTFPHEKDLLLFLEEELTRLGIECRRMEVEEDRWNLLARLGSGFPIICLNTHADTVPPNGESTPEPRIKDGRLYGLGSCDAKASSAAMITAMKNLRDTPFNGTVDLLISVDEEGDAKGIRTAVRQGYRCDYAIIGEPTGLDVVSSHCGLLFVEITTKGVATHGSAPWNGVNAIDKMTNLVDALRTALSPFPSHHLVGPVSLNLGAIKGGDRPNRVPELCWTWVDIRLVPPTTTSEVMSAIESALEPYTAQGAEWKVTKCCEPLCTPIDSPLVAAVQQVAGELTGGKSEMIGLRGWTEAESFQTGLGVDAVVFGAGHLQQAHSGDEFVDIDQVQAAALAYERIVRQLIRI